MSSFSHYLAWQVPGWVVAGAVLALIVAMAGWPWWIVAAGIAGLVARDLVFYPAMRATFRPAAPARPIGARGVALEALRPEGLVRVDGELWRARACDGAIPERGDVVVAGADGLTLLVTRPDRDGLE
jgi:membrane protein implicated in regulation of membrane protease activity